MYRTHDTRRLRLRGLPTGSLPSEVHPASRYGTEVNDRRINVLVEPKSRAGELGSSGWPFLQGSVDAYPFAEGRFHLAHESVVREQLARGHCKDE